MSYILSIFLIILCVYKPITEQTPDILNINGHTYYLKSFPLDDLRLKSRKSSSDSIIDTGCWRGYQATWTVINDSLFLVKMTDCYNKYIINMESYFADHKPKVKFSGNKLFANWYDAELVKYEHHFLGKEEVNNYVWRIDWRGLKKEEQIVMTFKKGILTSGTK